VHQLRRSLAIAAPIASGCATSLPEPVTGYTCCNLRSSDGWVYSSNVQGGALIPAGEPIELTVIKRQYYVYGIAGGEDISLSNDSAKSQADTMRWLDRIVVKDDPRPRIATWPDAVRLAVAAGRVTLDMTREQVLVALGYPSPVDTPDIRERTWRYWTAAEDEPVDLRFDMDDRLVEIKGAPGAMRAISYSR